MKGFQTNRDVLKMIKDQQSTTRGGHEGKTSKGSEITDISICEKHRQPMVIFCDGKYCQEIVCQTCVLLKHKDHKVMEIFEKADEVKKEMTKLQPTIQNHIVQCTTHIEKLDEIKKDISASGKEVLDKIEAERKKLVFKIEREAAEKTRRVFEIHQNDLKKIDFTCDDLKSRKANLEECKTMIEKLNLEENSTKIISEQANVEQHYRKGLATSANVEKRVKHYYKVKYTYDTTTVLPKQVIGNVNTRMHEVDYDLFVDNAVKVRGWKPGEHTYAICWSHETGRIYTASECTIQAFDLEGKVKMTQNVKPDMYRRELTCFYTNGEDFLMLQSVKTEDIEIREGLTGKLLHVLNLSSRDRSRPQTGIWQDSPGKVLICTASYDPYSFDQYCTLTQYNVSSETLTKTTKEFKIDSSTITGVTVAQRNNKKILVVACGSDDDFIVAVDYENGHTLWKVRPNCDNLSNFEEICPLTMSAICTDGIGHLFIADCNNYRVIVMDMEGNVQKEICTDIGGNCNEGAFVSGKNKLIVSDWVCNVYVYDITYL